MNKLTLFVGLFSLLIATGAQASQCYCSADPYSKTYDDIDGIVKTWYGGKRAWSCVYTCSTPQGQTQIKGHHKKTYIGDDNGLWGICDGLIYTEQYNNFSGNFVYMLEGEKKFDPEDSTSEDLTRFAKEKCQ